MKNFVKYTLVSAAVAATFGVAAGTLTSTALQVSKQGAASAAATATQAASFTHTVAAGYAINDLVKFTVTSGAVASSFTWPSTIEYAAGSGGASMTLTLLSGTAGSNEGSYRVTNVTASTGQTTIGAVSDPISVTLKTNALAVDASVSVASTLSNGSTPIDPTTAVTIAEAKDQFGDLTVSQKFAGTIDVAQGRKAFVSSTSLPLVFKASEVASLVAPATVTSTVVKVNADLGELTTAAVSVSGGSPTKAYDATNKVLTLTYNSAVTTDQTVTITPPTGSAAKVLVAGDFKLAGTVNYGTASAESIGSSIDAGEWTLNGAMVNVPYVPFGANVSRVFTVTNTGSLDADVTLTAIDESGVTYDVGTIAVAKANSVTSLSAAVFDALNGAVPGLNGKKLSLTFTINAENKDVTVYAMYNVGGADRATVPTSQYKN
ncbi:hypothetical protein [Rheinheimera sp.]|uniref:hypothetical protein n=1 Tax=Rheinheimera sp. TaxID=1869214 RepID=UPI00307D53E0